MTTGVSLRGTAALLALAIAAPGFAQAPAVGAQDLTSAMTRCAAFKDEKDRHACTDDAMIAAGLMAAPTASDKRYRFGLPFMGELKPEPKDAAGKAPAKYVARYVEPDQPRSIAVTLRSIVDRGDGKLMFLTTDGAVWRQTEREDVRPFPRAGQTMTIERVALGGYLCKLGKWKAYRCHRPGIGN